MLSRRGLFSSLAGAAAAVPMAIIGRPVDVHAAPKPEPAVVHLGGPYNPRDLLIDEPREVRVVSDAVLESYRLSDDQRAASEKFHRTHRLVMYDNVNSKGERIGGGGEYRKIEVK